MAEVTQSESLWQAIVSMPQRAWDSMQTIQWKDYPLLDVAFSFGLGFLTGFLLRRYFQYLVIGGVAVVIVLLALNSFNILHVDWHHLRLLTGIDAQMSLASCIQHLIQLAHQHMVIFVSFLVGFLVGFALM